MRSSTAFETRIVDFSGIVQGVGFRPFIARLAIRYSVSGWIQNRTGRVRASFTGKVKSIDELLFAVESEKPPLCRIDKIELLKRGTAEAKSDRTFTIIESMNEDSCSVLIPPDIAICPDCSEEIKNPNDRRYGYAFTTCVNCGPRYTIVKAMPYDRINTAMHDFPLCQSCQEEYSDPQNRRFHAETIACKHCGPELTFKSRLTGESSKKNALKQARKTLHEGGIVAVKGIGGFLLAANARCSQVLENLRTRKKRPHKPFAVMAASIRIAESTFNLSAGEKKLITSHESPIVIVNANHNPSIDLPLHLISPDSHTIGIMLPTSPLHELLFEPLEGDPTPAFDFLIMTSGNKQSEPISINNQEAFDRLSGIADGFLTHNRDIILRNDDSLAIEQSTGPQIWRRARGFAPAPIKLNTMLRHCILAMGAEIKNTISLGYENEVVMSPHIGDLENPEAFEHLESVADQLPEFLNKSITRIAVDLNSDMHSSLLGRTMASKHGIPVIEVQHHQAHAMACLAENGLESGLAVVLDGTGLGYDENIWGSELFFIEDKRIFRMGTFKPAPLPGGDQAVREPARQVAGRMAQLGISPSSETLNLLNLSHEKYQVWKQLLDNKSHCPLSSGTGRLFDTMSVLLGCSPGITTYEGQPAVMLENLASSFNSNPSVSVPFKLSEAENMLTVDWSGIFTELPPVSELRKSASEWASAFHIAVADAVIAMIEYAKTKQRFHNVALSGGVMMNRILHSLLEKKIRDMDLTPHFHSLTPPNDGCISLGQIVIADWSS